MINIKPLDIPGVMLLTPEKHQDERGYVCEVSSDKVLQVAGLPPFVQDNQSYSHKKHTVRALHFQKPPHAQGKLVRVLRGAIFDVAVDLRPTSPTFGKHVAMTLSDKELSQFYIPAGFAHGFCTLADETIVLYKLTSFFAPDSEGGILWNDPDLNITWPVDAAGAIVSKRDQNQPRFKDGAKINW